MQRRWLSLLPGLLVVAACQESPIPTQPTMGAGDGARSPLQPPQVIHGFPGRWTPGAGRVSTQSSPPPIQYAGGPILPTTKVAAIYWGASPLYTNGPTPGTAGAGANDASLIGYFLNHLGGSTYFNINTTYFDALSGGRPVQNVVTYTQYWAPNTSIPPADGTPVSDATIQAELIQGFNTGKLTYDSRTVYAVFAGGNTNLGGSFPNQFCAYHTYFTWNGNTVIYAAMPYVNQYPGSCSETSVSPNGDAAADREINVLAHEIEEATTDFRLNAWRDAAGDENADKCAWTFGTTFTTPNGGTANVTIGSKSFLIQQNWTRFGGGGCAQGLGIGPTASGSLIASIFCLCNTQAVINSVTASGNAITLHDNGGHSATITLAGATASGGLTASLPGCVCAQPPAAIKSITATAHTITLTDNGGHTGTISVTGASVSGGLTASVTCLCNDTPAITALKAANNSILLADGGGHIDLVMLAP